MKDKVPDLIVEGDVVLTMVDGQEPISNGRVCVCDGIITEVAERQKDGNESFTREAEKIGGSRTLVMPGLINGHTHAAMSIFRGLADDLPLKAWLFEKIFPAEARYVNENSVYWGCMLSCLEMMASGTTCIADGYFFQDATVKAVSASGMRGIISQGVIDFPAPGVEDPRENLLKAEEFISRWSGFSDMIIPSLFCHSPVTCSKKTLTGSAEIAADYGVPLMMHLSETAREVDEILKSTGLRPVHYLAELGVLDRNLVAAHAVHLDEGEISRIRENGVAVVHVPESNMKLCSGIARVHDMVEAGIKVGLGTDGSASNNDLDLLVEMDTAAKLGKVFSGDPTRMDARSVLKMATVEGASVLGLDNEIGTLEVGKKADIITIDLNSPNLCPFYDPYSAIVYSACGGNVSNVIIDGKTVMRNRKFSHIEKSEVINQVVEIAREIESDSF